MDFNQTQTIAIDVINAAGQIDPSAVIDYIKPNGYKFLGDHQHTHPESGLKQNAFRLFFQLDAPTSIKEAAYIGKDMATELLTTFADIDLHGGSVRNVSASIPKEVELKGAPLKAEGYKERRQAERDLESLVEATSVMTKSNAITPAELIDMAEYIEKKGVKIEDDQFDKIALGVWNSQLDGEYDEETAIEILKAIDNVWHEDAHYESFKPSSDYKGKRSTIATFIWYAKEQGYERTFKNRFYVESTDRESIPTETIDIEQYIGVENMIRILKSDEKNILAVSPTGSGKTSSSIPAARQLMDEDDDLYVFIPMPYKALAIQAAKELNIGEPVYGRKSAKVALQANIKNTGYKMVTGTYDKVPHFMDAIKNEENAKVIIIADEAHKEVTDYSYRRRAITGLFDLREDPRVVKFIGLSGTPQQINKDYYDKMVTFNQTKPKQTFGQINVLEYSKSTEYTKTVSELIAKEHKDGRKVLAFIERKAIIQEASEVLRGMGIKVASVMSERGNETQSPTYRHLMYKQAFPEGVDVVISTSVIADGINIINESDQYSCIIAPHYTQSRIFDLSTIKQMTNRLRNPYDRLVIPLFIKEDLEDERREQTALYGFEERVEELTGRAKKVQGFIEERFSDKLNQYSPGVIEALNGLYYINPYDGADGSLSATRKRAYIERALQFERHWKANPYKEPTSAEQAMMEFLDETRKAQFKIDLRTMDMKASQDAEDYYAYNPYAFIPGIEHILKMKSEIDTVTNYIEGLDKSVSLAVESHLAEIEEIKKEDEKAKHERINEILTETVFNEIQTDYVRRGSILEDSPVWKELNELMSKRDLSILKDILPFVGFEEALKVANTIESTTKSFAFRRSLKAYAELEKFQKAEEKTVTHIIVDELKRRVDDEEKIEAGGEQCLLNGQRKRIWAEVADVTSEKVDTIKKIYNQFIVEETAKKKAAVPGAEKKVTKDVYWNFRFVNLKDIGKKYGIEEEAMQEVYKRYKHEKYASIAS